MRRLASHQRDLQAEHHPRIRDPHVGERIPWIARDGALEVFDRPVAAVTGALAPEETSLQVQLVRLGIFGLVPGERSLLLAGQTQGERAGHARRDRVLDREDVAEPLVERVGPERPSGCRADQLHGHADAIARSPDAAVEKEVDAQLARGARRILLDARILQDRSGRPHDEGGDPAEPGDERVGQANREVFVLSFRGQIAEREDGGGRRRRRALDGCHRLREPVAAAGHRDDEAGRARVFAERLPEIGNGLRETVFFDRRLRPHGAEQRVFVHQFSAAADERHQRIERLGQNLDGRAAAQEQPLPGVDAERTELVDTRRGDRFHTASE